MRFACSLLLVLLPVAVPAVDALAGPLSDRKPPGPHFRLKARAHAAAPSFKPGEPRIGTSYFYWYDVRSGSHIRNPDGSDALTTHPPDDEWPIFSFASEEWHYRQLKDMAAAKIDFLMPVYWGVPGVYSDNWSLDGLPPLVRAHDRIAAEHRKNSARPAPPAIGMFYDTSTLKWNTVRGHHFAPGEHINLATPRGKEWFYVTIRDFFSMIPPAKWARVDGRPIVFLYAEEFAADQDGTLFEDTQRRFREDFGCGLFIVRHADFKSKSDGWYQWGGAIRLTIGDIAAGIGPGYDHTATGRKPLVVEREGGRFYERQWEELLRMPPSIRPWLVHLETWNEYHEGTNVSRSREHGDQYIRLTARYADMFHKGVHIEKSGPYKGAEMVRWSEGKADGLKLRPSREDGKWELRTVDGVKAVTSIAGDVPTHVGYLYFDIDESYAFCEIDRSAEVTLIFRDDGGCESFYFNYDNVNPDIGDRAGAFRGADGVKVGNTGQWRTLKVRLPEARFANRANGADFRIAVVGGKGELSVREVTCRLLD